MTEPMTMPKRMPRSLSRSLSRAVAAVAVATLSAALGAGPASAVSPSGAAHETTPAGTGGRWLVRYAPGTDMAAAARSLRSDGVAVAGTVTRAVDVAVVTATPAEAAAIADSPRVLSVEPDARVRTVGTQVNPTWGLDRIDQRALPVSNTFTAPDAVTPVLAYVVDTGVRATHVELAGRVATGMTVIPDGLGTADCNGHGTHVAGTIAGSTYGVAKSATVVPVRVLDCTGAGAVSGVIQGLDWLVGHHQPGVAAVANMSLGGLPNDALDAAVQAAVDDGITVAVAAGNDAALACGASPARALNALTVAASTIADLQATFSNHGSCVDLFAPGVDITSAWGTGDTTLATISGTSMASPHVAGAAAVLLSQLPTLSPAQVTQRLVGDATPDVISNVSPNTANRLLFLDQYQTPPPQPPPPPPPPAPPATAPAEVSSVDAAPRVRSARVKWVVGGDGGSPLVEQKVRVYREGERVRTVEVRPDKARTRVKGLRPGVAYRFSVVAINAVGSSPESEKSESVRPRR